MNKAASKIFPIVGLLTSPVLGDETGIPIPKSIEPFFATHCYDCHDEATSKADLNLEGLTRSIANSTDALHWQDILDQLNAGEMPPKKKLRPPKDELAGVVGDLTEALQAAHKLLRDSGGEIALRRLNQREYTATIKNLMGIRLSPDKLPDDPGGRFDTIGQNQSLSAIELEKYFAYGREVARTALHWACEPRQESKVLERKEFANTEGRSKRIYEIMEKVRLVKEEGKTPAEAGLTDKEWPKYDPDSPNAQKAVWKGQREYYDRNRPIHAKGRMLSHDLLVENVNIFVRQDARAHYRVRFCGGVVDGVNIRRGVRLMEKNGKLGGKHGRAFGSFWIRGTIEEPSTHETLYYPAFQPDFRPDHWHQSRRHLYLLEDKRGGPSSEQFYHHYRPIEPEAPKDTIFAKWMEVEGPFYDPKSPFEKLVEKYQLATATDEGFDSVAARFLAEFAEIAFRKRGLPEGYQDRLFRFYQEKRKVGLSFREAIVDPLAMILTSTRFLYLLEPREKAAKERTLDAVSMANRLSYFLWSSPPDKELLKLAEGGELLKPAVLEQQLDRMLDSPLADQFFKGFMSQWTHLDRFDSLTLNSKLLLHRTDGMIQAARQEPIEFFKTLVRENLPAANLIDSDFVMVNGVLAMKYGLAEVYAGDAFKKLQLPPGSPRGGLMTQSAFLSAGTMGNRTSPVIRGSLVKEILLNDPPPPPPPNVPELDAGANPLASVRSLVELHQTKAQCASCHARFDFIGLGLENFDAAGLWRDEELVTEAQEAQQVSRRPKKIYPVDASGELPNGETFKDVHGLKAALMKEERAVAASIFEGLLCYALGRDVSFTDLPMIEKALNELEPGDFPVRTMIKRIVTSQLFQSR